MNPGRDPTTRFSGRVGHYARYRPGYPRALMDYFRRELDLTPQSAVADVGSGTGILARMFLEQGHLVYAVEPNHEMRAAAEHHLAGFRDLRSVDGTAERTGLDGGSVDLVTAAQAFHWFRADEARREFARILRPPARVALVWNRRRTEGAFLEAYERLLREHGTDYGVVDHRKVAVPEVLCRFFHEGSYVTALFDNYQVLDWNGLRGRVLSSSYTPAEGHDGHEAMMLELSRMFEAFQEGGRVRVDYETEIHWGRVA